MTNATSGSAQAADSQVTLAGLVDRYLDSCRGNPGDQRRVLRLFAETARYVPARKLGRRDIERWLGSRSGVATSVRQVELLEVRRFTKWLLEEGVVARDPCAAVPAEEDPWQVGFAEDAVAGPTFTSVREALLLRGLSQRTVRIYHRVIMDVERWCEDRGTDLEHVPVQVLLGYLAARPASHSTRKMIRCAIGHYWAICERPDPPLAIIRVPPKPRMVCRALEEVEAQRLVSTAKQHGEPEGWAVLLGLYQGLRRAEIANLRWDNFSDAGLTVTGKGELTATIPAHSAVVEMFQGVARSSEWIFPDRFGGPVTPTTIWQWVRNVAEAAGLSGVTVHRLRHTCISTANDATGDLRAVQAFARHSKPETTAGYTRASARRLNAVVKSIGY